MFSAGLVVTVCRISQKYAVQNFNALYITGPDTEHSERFFTKLLGINGDFLSFFITGIQRFTLLEKNIFWRFYRVQGIQRCFIVFRPDSVIYLIVLFKRHVKIHIFCDGGKE